MTQQAGCDFSPPSVSLGEQVLYYSDPTNLKDPVMGWVSRRPGANTIYVLVFSEGAGFIEKPSVRHADDPGLQENPNWRQWGCWQHHPQTELLGKLKSLLPQIVTLLARQGGKH